MQPNRLLVVALSSLLFLAGGCAHYYKVNDPAGSKEYYTKKIKEGKGGTIKIKDEKTGATVTLQSSEVKEITKEEYEAAVGKKKEEMN